MTISYQGNKQTAMTLAVVTRVSLSPDNRAIIAVIALIVGYDRENQRYGLDEF